MRGLSLRHVMVGAAAVVAALTVGASVASAGGGATLSLQAFPSPLLSGGSGAVLATFANTGNSTLTHVIVNVDLAGATFNAPSSSAACSATATGASCSLGNVKKGGSIASTIAFTNGPASPATFAGTATWDAASVGNPHGAAAGKDTTSGSVDVDVLSLAGLAGAASICPPGGGSLGAMGNSYAIDVTAGSTTRTCCSRSCPR
jgi:hypothetical protein